MKISWEYLENILEISWKYVLKASFFGLIANSALETFFAEIDTYELYTISKYLVSFDKTIKTKFHSIDNREVCWTGYETAIW